MCSRLRSELVTRLSTQITRCPRARSSSQRCEPRKPAPPVTTETGTKESVDGAPGGLTGCLLQGHRRPTDGVEGHRGSSENVMPMRFPLAALATALVVAAVVLPASPAEAAPRCAQDRATPAYAGSVLRALRSKRDLWGEQLIRRPGGPTYAAVRRLLKPLLFARARSKPLTASGVYYLPFAQPLGSPRRTRHRPPRRRRQPDPRAHDGRREPARPRRAGRARALRLLPFEALGSRARRGLPADPRDEVQGLCRRPLRAGVLRGPRARHRRPDQLRQRHRERRQERSPRATRPLDQARRPVGPGRPRGLRAPLPRRARPDRDPLRRLASRRPSPRRDRRGHVPARARPAGRVLERAPRRGRQVRRPRVRRRWTRRRACSSRISR